MISLQLPHRERSGAGEDTSLDLVEEVIGRHGGIISRLVTEVLPVMFRGNFML